MKIFSHLLLVLFFGTATLNAQTGYPDVTEMDSFPAFVLSATENCWTVTITENGDSILTPYRTTVFNYDGIGNFGYHYTFVGSNRSNDTTWYDKKTNSTIHVEKDYSHYDTTI